MTTPNTTLGEYTIAPVSSSTPAQYQAIGLENAQTVYDTYEVDHVPLGSTQNAGYHNKVTLAPQAAAIPLIAGLWQIYALGTNIYLAPPSGTGVAQQLNSSALLTSGTYWVGTATSIGGGVSAQLYYACPLGSNAITITLRLVYPTSAVGAFQALIPYKDASGAALLIPVIMSSFGIGVIQSTSGGFFATTIGWGSYTSVGTASSVVGVYTNGIVISIGKASTSSSQVVVSAIVTGAFS